ncbi:hypothetical protein P280DRAFT_209227 [Massarina eburnea CBS 473.64]|uniref:Uncharacterized protein n=1 Tax=Massarina eburnea CBS 473.64 TaxID=1395130 RepID=A0A6A6RLH6_9PLEO|nr:hypothetical protein P280DRAFT_209227 [Massarina eburnea CBS 473.64]
MGVAWRIYSSCEGRGREREVLRTYARCCWCKSRYTDLLATRQPFQAVIGGRYCLHWLRLLRFSLPFSVLGYRTRQRYYKSPRRPPSFRDDRLLIFFRFVVGDWVSLGDLWYAVVYK